MRTDAGIEGLGTGTGGPAVRAVVEYLGVAEEGDRIWYAEFPQPKDGMWSPYPDRPGLGPELNPKSVERYSV